MKRVLIDVGNTRTKFVWSDGEVLGGGGACPRTG